MADKGFEAPFLPTSRMIRASIGEHPLSRKNLSGLHSPGLFAKRPMIGSMMFLLGGLAFGIMVYNLRTSGPLIAVDVSLYNQWHSQAVDASARINELMLLGFFLGKEFIQVFFVILGLYLLYKRLRLELALLLVGSGGGSMLWRALNILFDRPRPPEQLGIFVGNPSFPSGHAMSAILFYGLLAYLLVPVMPSRFWKWLIVIVMLLLVAFGGYSRLFQGSHYLTDVLSGYALGIAWAGFIFTLVEKYFEKEK
jgi:membrane-associated phospholipid phosphatase